MTMYIHSMDCFNDIPIKISYKTVVDLTAIYSLLRECNEQEASKVFFEDPDLVLRYIITNVFEKQAIKK